MWAEAPRILFPALIQPYLGFAFGFCVGKFAARQPKYRAITIAIETGIQNATIPMVMLQGSFEQPYGDIAATMPVTTALYTPIPLMFTFIGLTVYNKFFKEKCGGGNDEEEGDGDEKEGKEKISEKEWEARAEKKSAELDKSYHNSTSNHRYERDSLLIQNGLTGSQLGKKFFLVDKESTI